MKKWITILLLCFVAFFVNNSAIIPDIMESRNLISAREMAEEGHWLVPTMNGELRLEKPPLPTWIAGAVETVLPDHLWAQRAMAGIAATMLVVFFFLLGKRRFGDERYALIASLLLITCYNIILMGRTASWDIYCHAFMMGAIYFLVRGLYEERAVYRNFILSGLFFGLSFMSKGPISLYALFLPFVIAIVLYDRPSMKGKTKPLIVAAIIALIVGSWWYIYLLLFHPEATQAVMHKESSNWVEHHTRPWYYYWKFFLETGVWSLLMITTLIVSFWKSRVKERRKYYLAIAWALCALVLLSLFPEKKTRYLLPMLIPCCYAMAFVVYHWIETRRLEGADKVLYLVNSGLIALVSLAVPVLLYVMFYLKGLMSAGWFIVSAVLLLIVSVALICYTVKIKPGRFLYAVVALFVVSEIFLMNLIAEKVNNPDFNSIEQTYRMPQLKGIPFYYNEQQELRIEMVYQAHRNIRPIDLTNADSIRAHLPMAVLTHDFAGNELPATLWNDVDSVYIGRFDDNHRPKSSGRYSDLFLYNVTLLRTKNAE